MFLNLNHIPLFRLLGPFILGIIGVVFIQPSTFSVLCSFGLSFSLLSIIVIIKKIKSNFKLRWLLGILIYANTILGAATITSLKYKDTASNTKKLTATSNRLLIGTLIEPIQKKANSLKTILHVDKIKAKNKWIKGAGKVIVYLQKDSLSKQLKVGDAIVIAPKIKNVSPPKNPNEFNFKKYLSFHLIHQQAYLNSNNWQLLQKGSDKNIFRFANDSREYLINTLKQKGIEGKELAVAAALILGYKDNIDVPLKNAYASAGAMHVLAVSGLHVGIIFLIFSQLLYFLDHLKKGAIIKGILLIIILWLYALLTGLSPSVMRAATMFSFIVATKMAGRYSSFFNTLAASALVLLLFNPLLIMEVGFQLSYMAVVGIVIIQPWINDWFTIKYWLPRKIWEITAVSIAAQIATFPLGLLYFHQFPNYFMLSNLVVIPLAIAILYLGILTLSLSFVPFIGNFLALLLKYIIQFLNYAVQFIDKIPYSLTENIRFSILDTWLIYLFISSIILLIKYKKANYLYVSCALIITFLTSSFWFSYTDLDQQKIIIYNIPKHTTINFIDGTNNVLIADSALIYNRKKLMFHVQNNWIKSGLKKEHTIQINQLLKNDVSSNYSKNNLFIKNVFFQFYDKKIVLLTPQHITNVKNKKLAIDLLIISKNAPTSIKKILREFKPKQIIIDGSNSLYNSKRLKKEAKELNLKCWSVLVDGAYVMDLK